MKTLVGLLSIFALATTPVLAEDELTAVISGVVSNSAKMPMPNVQVILLDQGHLPLGDMTTDQHGNFHFKHNVCNKCNLEVLPALDTHYACALIDNIPGNANRNFLLTLQRGFNVSGKVAADKKGMKGITLKVTSLDVSQDGKQVHDGGLAKTARNGTFNMILTPGHKRVVVLNDKYPEYKRESELKIEVTGDTQLPEIKLEPEKK